MGSSVFPWNEDAVAVSFGELLADLLALLLEMGVFAFFVEVFA